MKIVRLPSFDRTAKRAGIGEADISRLLATLLADPSAGVVIPGSGGVRKVRFAVGKRGKRGGGRGIYMVVRSKATLYLLLAYDKSEKTDLTPEEKKHVRALAETLKS